MSESETSSGIPLINTPAPDFEVTTTQGVKKLSDYKGRWLVLFSHPADFTPVCTTEFIAFSGAYQDFQAIGCELLGLSIDSNQSHLAWIRNIKQNFGVEVPFPVIADLDKKVAARYGMIHPGASDTATVRAVFVIDPGGMLRALVYYPLTNGRSVSEIFRLVRSLQTTDEHAVSTPEGWKPGDKVIVPPPATQDAADARQDEGYEYVDWYFSKKDLSLN